MIICSMICSTFDQAQLWNDDQWHRRKEESNRET